MLPLTRIENWLAMIAGDSDADEAMQPRTREEKYLAKIAGVDITTPEPRTRKEHYLNEIAENGGGGGGGGTGFKGINIAIDVSEIGEFNLFIPCLYTVGGGLAVVTGYAVPQNFSIFYATIPATAYGAVIESHLYDDDYDVSVVSGDAEIAGGNLVITGECTLKITRRLQ